MNQSETRDTEISSNRNTAGGDGNDPLAVGPSQRGAIWVYLVVTALSAACGLVVEIVAGRMIAPYLGMSLYTWTAIIAVVLAGFSLGHWIGGRIAEKKPALAARDVGWALLFAALTAAASLVLIRILSGPVINLNLPALPTILIITTALFFLPSVFVGIPSPVLTKLAIDTRAYPLGHILGTFYAAGAVGSIAGTLAAGFVFISWLGTINTILLVAAVYIALAVLMFRDALRLVSLNSTKFDAANSRATTLTNIVLPLAIGIGLGFVLLAAGSAVRAFTSNCDYESDYYCIRVVDASADLGTPARILVLDHLGHGINLREVPNALVSGYVETQDRLVELNVQTDGQFSAFFIGGGAYTLPRAWLHKYPAAKVVVSEIDPQVTAAAGRHMWLDTAAPNLEMRSMDARRALGAETGPPTYDVIVGDAFHDIAVPQHLVTREFYALVRARLRKDGMYVMNVVDSPTAPRLMLSVADTLRQVFPTVEIWQSNEEVSRATYVIAAMEKPTQKSLLGSRLQQGLAWVRLTDATIAKLAQRLSPLVLTDDFAPVDRLIGAQ